MPLDSTNWSQTDTETKPDLSKPSLEGLSWLLRHLPADHKWDFTKISGPTPDGCGSAGCALGLIQTFWNRSGYSMGVPMAIADRFFLLGQYLPTPDYLVTSTMVADRIDAYLAERHA